MPHLNIKPRVSFWMPSSNLFRRESRALSSGCVRVNKASELAGISLSVLTSITMTARREMERRYAHLAPNYLAEHAYQIGAVFDSCVPNLSHSEGSECRGIQYIFDNKSGLWWVRTADQWIKSP